MKKLILLLLFIPLVSCENGQAKNTVDIVNGLKQGEENLYFSNGNVKATVNYVDNLKQGEGKTYFKSGKLDATYNYVDGLLNGKSHTYYYSGALKSTNKYLDNKNEIETKVYYRSGGIKSKSLSVNGVIVREIKYESPYELLLKSIGEIRETFYNTGKLLSTVYYVNGVKQGEEKWYYDSVLSNFEDLRLYRIIYWLDGVEQERSEGF